MAFSPLGVEKNSYSDANQPSPHNQHFPIPTPRKRHLYSYAPNHLRRGDISRQGTTSRRAENDAKNEGLSP